MGTLTTDGKLDYDLNNPPPSQPGWRLCIGSNCRQAFWSTHAGNRICPACEAGRETPPPPRGHKLRGVSFRVRDRLYGEMLQDGVDLVDDRDDEFTPQTAFDPDDWRHEESDERFRQGYRGHGR